MISPIHAKLYPVDERLWLLSTAYNTGVECLQFVIHLVSGSPDMMQKVSL